MYEILVINTVTKETAKFLGQGQFWDEAVRDGLRNVAENTSELSVRLLSGETVRRHQNDFESEAPYPEVDAVWEDV